MFKDYLKKIYILSKKILSKCGEYIIYALNSWPRAIVGTAVLVVILYYPVGGSMVEKIDRDLNFRIKTDDRISSTIDIMHILVDREINEHFWTANLPIFFPSYFLDNMPNYQMGMIKAIANVATPISEQIRCQDNEKEEVYMKTAAELLSYPGDVWVFSPDNKLKIAPSSSSQYRKARKRLLDVNEVLDAELCIWHRGSRDLSSVVSKITADLGDISNKLEKQTDEESLSWFDIKSDDVFYISQGKIYVYAVLMKALAQDYKETILANNLYQDWTKAVRALENAVEIQPQMVRNGNLNSSFASNHLISMGYYAAKAENILLKINSTLSGDK